MSAPEAVTPVTLWRGDHYEGNSFFLSESKHQRREEWKALPAAQYAELVAYAKTGEAVEGVLIEANEDDGTMTPADVVRALVAERDALKAVLIDLEQHARDVTEETGNTSHPTPPGKFYVPILETHRLELAIDRAREALGLPRLES